MSQPGPYSREPTLGPRLLLTQHGRHPPNQQKRAQEETWLTPPITTSTPRESLGLCIHMHLLTSPRIQGVKGQTESRSSPRSWVPLHRPTQRQPFPRSSALQAPLPPPPTALPLTNCSPGKGIPGCAPSLAHDGCVCPGEQPGAQASTSRASSRLGCSSVPTLI